MFKVVIIAGNGKYSFRKQFEFEAIPMEGRDLWVLNRKLSLTPKWITQDLDTGIFEVFCDANLEALYDLYNSKTGWLTTGSPSFLEDPAMIREVEKRDARIEKVRREIAKHQAEARLRG